MSSRTNAARYGGGSGQRGGMSLMQILAAAKGYNKTTGGPQVQTMPDGTQSWSYQPATAKQGFLSRWGTGTKEADALNAQIGGSAYLQQLKGALDKETQRIQGDEMRKTEVTRGEQTRISDKEKHVLDIKEWAEKSYTDLLKATGQPDSPETRKQFETQVLPLVQRSLVAKESQRANFNESDTGKRANKLGFTASAVGEYPAQFKRMQQELGPNTMGVNSYDLANPADISTSFGPSEVVSSVQHGQSFNPKTLEMTPEQRVQQTSYTKNIPRPQRFQSGSVSPFGPSALPIAPPPVSTEPPPPFQMMGTPSKLPYSFQAPTATMPVDVNPSIDQATLQKMQLMELLKQFGISTNGGAGGSW